MILKALVITGDSGVDYTVTANEHVRCTCPAFRYGDGKACKHIEFALATFAVAH